MTNRSRAFAVHNDDDRETRRGKRQSAHRGWHARVARPLRLASKGISSSGRWTGPGPRASTVATAHAIPWTPRYNRGDRRGLNGGGNPLGEARAICPMRSLARGQNDAELGPDPDFAAHLQRVAEEIA
jgi:hypothetical protein